MRTRLSLLIILALAGCASAPPNLAAKSVIAELPSLALTRLDGSTTTLGSELDGRPAIVSLWATWCESCATEFDALNKLDERARARGAKIVAVSVGENVDQVRTFVSDHSLGYAQLADPDFRFADALGQRRVPATLVVDHQGRVVFRGAALDEAAIVALEHQLAGARK